MSTDKHSYRIDGEIAFFRNGHVVKEVGPFTLTLYGEGSTGVIKKKNAYNRVYLKIKRYSPPFNLWRYETKSSNRADENILIGAIVVEIEKRYKEHIFNKIEMELIQ